MSDLRTIRSGTAALFLGAMLTLVGRAPASLLAQDPPPKPGRPAPTDPKAQEREKRAQELWDAAEKFEQAGKFPEAQIKLRINDRSGAQGSWGKILWRQSKPRRKTDWEDVAREANASPDLIERFTKELPGARPFLFKPTEG